MEIPFHKPYTDAEDVNGVVGAIRSGWLTMGPQTIEFEQRFRKSVGAAQAVAVNSCTAAMHLALKAFNLQPGDEVIIPAMTFTATGEVVRYFNAVPVIVDVDKETHNILPEEIEKHIETLTFLQFPYFAAMDKGPRREIRGLLFWP